MNESQKPEIMGGANSKSIFFGPEIWSTQNYGGISRYFQNLIAGTSRVRQNTFAIVPKNFSGHSQSFPNTQIIPIDKERGRNLISEGLSCLSGESIGGIYHSTFYGAANYNLWRKNGYLNVITVHDLISEKFTVKKTINRPRIDQKKRAIKSADHIICISNTTKSELLKFYEIPEYKISVIYLGCDSFDTSKTFSFGDYKNNYLLFVGKRGWYKNFNRFILAFSHSKYLRDNFTILAFGGGEFTQSELSEFKDLKIEKNLKWMGGSDEKLAECYLNAAALIYPSLDEGFGLPPLEAMSLGCPVIASNQGSIPEICKENIVYFDPYDLESIRETIENTMLSSDSTKKNIVAGKKYVENFTWASTINKTNLLYTELLNSF